MKQFFGSIFLFVTVALIYFLDNSIGKLPPIGKIIDPMNGCWANAEPINKDYSFDYRFSALKNEVVIALDDRLVPHIHAENEHDLYFLQGFIHATFRLWQMDMQTRAAGGRISEVVGEGALHFDREQRRKGMVYGAQNSLKMMEADPQTKQMMDAYTEGINAFIKGLKYRDYPIEYKLMNFSPEKWTNLKTSLLMKFMADDLTGYVEDIPMTGLRDNLGPELTNLFYPDKIKGSTPVIPASTVFQNASLKEPTPPKEAIFPKFDSPNQNTTTTPWYAVAEKIASPYFMPFSRTYSDGTGSNNWAISGKRSSDSSAILCNDPHLGINLPSLWYEVQLQMPGMNVYGASLPGAPGVIIGFNDSLSWGFTNNYRDVKDYYTINYTDNMKNNYWFNGKQKSFIKNIEHIGIKGKSDYLDTINYTIQGPIIYDEHFAEPLGFKQPLALCWMAHLPSNELKAVYLLNKAENYDEYVNAIFNFHCPAQNMLFADRYGNIAIWGQGLFVNKWKDQGKYIMKGNDTSTLWQEQIPMQENPHSYNPEQGYLFSANQNVTDTSYPYWYNGHFKELRALRIQQLLNKLDKATINDMFKIQNDVYSILAANVLPLMCSNMPPKVNDEENKYLQKLKNWNFKLEAESEEATIFQIWWEKLLDNFSQTYPIMKKMDLYPPEEVIAGMLLGGKLLFEQNKWSIHNQSNSTKNDYYKNNGQIKWIDSVGNWMYDTITKHQIVINSTQNPFEITWKETIDSLKKLEKTTGLKWYKVKKTSVKHLAKLAPFSCDTLKIGGWGNTINAAKTDHAPSWRMVVKMGKEIEAYGIYPGGQSGNPGSKSYNDFINDWVAGKYYKLLFLPYSEKPNNPNIKFTMIFHP